MPGSTSGTWLANYPRQDAQQKCWIMRQQDNLDNGKLEKLIRSLRSIQPANPELGEKIQMEADFFQKNAERMRLSGIPPSAPACRLRRYRSRLQDRHRLTF
jgi:hypothetical protein